MILTTNMAQPDPSHRKELGLGELVFMTCSNGISGI